MSFLYEPPPEPIGERSPEIRTDYAPHLVVDVGEPDERDSIHLREMFLVSVVVHLLVVIIVITNPDIFQKLFPGAVFVKPPPKDVTLLYEPPETPKLKTPKLQPKPEANRKVEPKIEEPVPQRLLYRNPVPPPPSTSKPLGDRPELENRNLPSRQLPPIGLPEFPEGAKEPPKPALEPVPPAKPLPTPSQAQLQLPSIPAPDRGTDSILRGLARQHAAGGNRALQGGIPQGDPGHPNLNIPGPQILSDTMGVDFQPYLLRIYLLVRRNWYSVIPEIARLGKQGRVALEFSIQRNGAVPDLILRVGSGTVSLDSAALASIRLSTPFPALPAEFPGSDIRLRFIYLYNIPLTE